MNIVKISSTDLKHNTAEVLNSVAYGGKMVVVERYGEPLVRVIPVKSRENKLNFKKMAGKYFGAIPDFPKVHKMRRSRKRAVKL